MPSRREYQASIHFQGREVRFRPRLVRPVKQFAFRCPLVAGLFSALQNPGGSGWSGSLRGEGPGEFRLDNYEQRDKKSDHGLDDNEIGLRLCTLEFIREAS